MRALLAAVVLAVLLGAAVACSPDVTDGGATRVNLDDGSTALAWGDGEYGVVLVPGEGETPEDWAPLATVIAGNRMTVVAVDEAGETPDRLAAAASWLTGRAIQRIAYLASGTLGAERLAAYAAEGVAIDQVVMISGDLTDAELGALGESPKLFISAEREAAGVAAAMHMVEVAAGTWNALLLVPGSGHGLAVLGSEGSEPLINGVVARLEERR